MNNHSMQNLITSSSLFGGNASYLEYLYEQYLTDPNSVPSHWQEIFKELPNLKQQPHHETKHSQIREQFIHLARTRGNGHGALASMAKPIASGDVLFERKQASIQDLINAYRSSGHLKAQLDPLNLREIPNIDVLNYENYRLVPDDLDVIFSAGSWKGMNNGTLQEILTTAEDTYCSTIGFEFMHIGNLAEIRWFQERIERNRGKEQYDAETKKRLLRKLTAAEGLEKYLGVKYVGQKRFSLEGAESLICALDGLISHVGSQGAHEIIIGMAHRGRINVLINILGKAPEQLFQEFSGKHITNNGFSGDVKYHMGFSSDVKFDHHELHLTLAFNPSHLEIINPVVEGSVRSRQDRLGGDEAMDQIIPVLIHGDASFAGQGVVMETLNMSQARGFCTGGTVHIIVNNQIGFTISNPQDARSTLYCSDVAKMIAVPIFHVNADDPEAVLFATKLAADYRSEFHKDVVIDLICYRRHGHNEADEPMATQPAMYQAIKKHPTTRILYMKQLIKESVVSEAEAEAMMTDYREALDRGKPVVNTIMGRKTQAGAADWTPFLNNDWTVAANTSLPKHDLVLLAKQLQAIPKDFVLQKQVARLMSDRTAMTTGKMPINWGFAENLAYASLLQAGYSVRLCGQDSGRGTFAHRHAVVHDQSSGDVYIPLAHINNENVKFTLIDSLLSEEAVLAFEYGYSSADPKTLVLWEAQFGDFANGAQVVIDQFISSAQQKWARLNGLVMLLPHGYEGQGPEHSSARMERYLQLCAQHNLQVCVPTTPAQIFHLLRRQMLRAYRAPLIVMTPKSLLRHKLAVSSLQDLISGNYQCVLPEVEKMPAKQVKKVILCSGKVYYELFEKRQTEKIKNVAIIRLEQLYPFPENELKELLSPYKNVKDFVWCQEEPQNQGAWYQIQHRIHHCLYEDQKLTFVGREAMAAPASGYLALHQEKQEQLIIEALNIA